ncbi:ATP-binding cassette domain-containing protein [Henriciella sp.]|uniref:phosphonate ABC transporter ATP-binding protein n=1 Tax=Henriciella sp. TaxID=1968823 RepID=UPI002604D771|nr:ATP-binding cassette domain-containing protein [Henriciella sp.]
MRTTTPLYIHNRPGDLPHETLRVYEATKTFTTGPAALDKVSFGLKAGEFTVLLGPSGSGKSTLLRAAIGLVRLTSGTIKVSVERGIAPEKRKRPAIGMVHQDGSLSDRLTAAQNVLSAMAPQMGWLRVLFQAYPKHLQDKACRLLDRVGLTEDQANRPVRELSGGQRQRVGIARALMNDPTLILADEPVASLDPATARKVMLLLRETAREFGATVLCSLHQIELACELADRILLLRQGQLIFDGAASDMSPRSLAGLFEQDSAGRPFDLVGG